MNDVFSFDLVSRMFRIVPVSRVNLRYIADDRRQNLNTKFAHAHKHSEFTYSAYEVLVNPFNRSILRIGFLRRWQRLNLIPSRNP